MKVKLKIQILFAGLFGFVFFLAPLSGIYSENYSSVSSSFSFTRDLGQGNQGQDVENLQCILGINGPTGYFGSITKNTLIQFQNAHAADILVPVGLSTGTGYMGSSTRAYINSQISTQGSTSTPTCPTYSSSVFTPTPAPTPIPSDQTNPPASTSPTACPTNYICTPTSQGPLPTVPSFNSTGGINNSYGTYPSSPYINANPYQSSTGNNAQVSDYDPPSPSASTPITSNLNTSSAAFYTTNANAAALAQYQQNGNCSQHQDYQNCPGHPDYYANHIANSSRKCAIHPTIAYLEASLLPTAFPWIQINSDCRIGSGDVHSAGLALDLGNKNGSLTLDQGGSIVLWAAKPEQRILRISTIIFNHHLYTYNSQTGKWNDIYPWCDKVRDNVSGDDPCHTSHVHLHVN